MSVETMIALTAFAFVTSLSPGPSNFMLLTSGVNFGFVRTLPQVFGITAGFTTLLLGVGSGLGGLLSAFPVLGFGLKLAGGAYLLHLAWRIAWSRSLGRADGGAAARPLTFLRSAAFQWVNPKAWTVAVATMAVYTDPQAPFLSMAWICLVFALVNLPTVSTWAGFGVALRGHLSDPVRLKWFNLAMGLLLAATLWPMVA